MSQAISESRKMPGELQTLYAPIQEDLNQVEAILRQEVASRYPFIDRLANHGFRLGGKRLRPALVLLSARASGTLRREHHFLAAAVELIHTATLVHDDVLDEATMRRHLETVNARWDNEASVLLGDYLFAISVSLISSVDSLFACQALGRAARAMCEGELRQVARRGDFSLAEEDYLEIIANKTAALCACCCQLGAHYAGAAPDIADGLARYGQHLGIAFQITDDLLDLEGDEAKTGKSLGTDLRKQKATLPLIYLLAQLDPPQRAELAAILAHPNGVSREALRSQLGQSGAVAYCQQKAAWYVRRAKVELGILPETDARESLLRLADFVATRQQ